MTNPPASPPPVSAPVSEQKQAYWRATIRLILTLLAVWFVVAYLMGIVFAPTLNSVRIGEAPLGFWIAHNGAIYVFIALIAIYATRMRALDRQYGVEE
jgi:putative solute:sodium symporter small subunit